MKKPELFKPSLEEEKEVANTLAKLFSSRVGIGLSDGTLVQGEREKLNIVKLSEGSKKKYECSRCDGTGLVQSEDGSKTITCPQCDGAGTFNPYGS